MSFSYPKNMRFRCEKCALCCGDTSEKTRKILLLKTESENISENTGLDIDTFVGEIAKSAPYTFMMKKGRDGKCVFLKEKLCSIYAIRPLLCRFYPFELQKVKGDLYIFSCTHECPSIGRGPILKRRFFEKLFNESARLLENNQKNNAQKK